MVQNTIASAGMQARAEPGNEPILVEPTQAAVANPFKPSFFKELQGKFKRKKTRGFTPPHSTIANRE